MANIVRSQYRLPLAVDRWLKAKAAAEERTKNAQLVHELKQLMNSNVSDIHIQTDVTNGAGEPVGTNSQE